MGGKEYGNPLNPPVHIDQNLKIYIIGSKIKIVADPSKQAQKRHYRKRFSSIRHTSLEKIPQNHPEYCYSGKLHWTMQLYPLWGI